MTSLNGMVVLITGAAERAGREFAIGLARSGARVAVNHLAFQAETAALTVAAIVEHGGDAVAVPADITDAAACARLVEEVVAAYGRLDAVIHNASSFSPAPFFDVTEDAFDASLAVNLRGPFFLSQAAARVMVTQPSGGRIVALIGNSLSEAWPDFVPHAVGKAALARLMELLAVSLSPSVQCSSIAPSQFFRSDDGVNDALRIHRGEAAPTGALFRHPSGQSFREVATADVVATLIALLTAPPSLSGVTVRIDGGRALA